MTTKQKKAIWRRIMQDMSAEHDPIAASKNELYTTVSETADWIEANNAAYKQALTHGALFGASQLLRMFVAVAQERFCPAEDD